MTLSQGLKTAALAATLMVAASAQAQMQTVHPAPMNDNSASGPVSQATIAELRQEIAALRQQLNAAQVSISQLQNNMMYNAKDIQSFRTTFNNHTHTVGDRKTTVMVQGGGTAVVPVSTTSVGINQAVSYMAAPMTTSLPVVPSKGSSAPYIH